MHELGQEERYGARGRCAQGASRTWVEISSHPVPVQRRRTIDLAFTRAKVAVFVDGCFWQGCPDHETGPQSNSAWWQTKLTATRRVTVTQIGCSESGGWTVVRIWEHELPVVAADRIEAAAR
jgi:DNA mismatch endonuclease, patch repair protein